MNFHELGDNERAAVEVEKAKEPLRVGRVFTLSGTIALERGLVDAAETDFKTAVGLDAGESDAFFGLGKIYAQKSVWMDSAMNFMFAGYGFDYDEKDILTKIGLVEGSTMSEERKAKLLARKKFQLEKTRLTKATAYFNAAAGYYNAGVPDKALTWVRTAAAHPWLPRLILRDVLAPHGGFRGRFVKDFAGLAAPKAALLAARSGRGGAMHADLDPRLTVISMLSLGLWPFLALPVLEKALGFQPDEAGIERLIEHTVRLFKAGTSTGATP